MAIRRGILAHQGHKCLACHRPFGPNLKPTKDHVIPLSQGGGLTADNVVALCGSCNSRKKDRHIDYRKPRLRQRSLFA